MTVADLNQQKIIELLSQQGFRYKANIVSDNLVGMDACSDELRKLYFREKAKHKEAHIHIRELGRMNQVYPLLFRDFLCQDKLVREAYGQVKSALALRFSDDLESYYAIKDPYMDTIYRAACLWAEKVNWQVSVYFQ